METDNNIPKWVYKLNEEDFQFIKRFILCSCSLKNLDDEYNISYPTIRIRLDRLIAKVKLLDKDKYDDSFRLKIQLMVADGLLSTPAAKKIYNEHLKEINKEAKK
ncbi:MAG TPA: DUF2089 family protein [bacterium]|nr:DUF2089 family protein [bacterium]HPN29681.1 DUF2089 family protein [bacterium]